MTTQEIQKLYDQYVTAEGAITFPKRITDLVRQTRYERYGKIATRKRVEEVVDFAVALAGAAVLLEKPEEAKAALRAGFHLVNGTRIEPEYWHHECGCMCDVAERFGSLANGLGFPEVARFFGPSTMCPSSPSGYRPNTVPGKPPAPEEILNRARYFLQHLKEEEFEGGG